MKRTFQFMTAFIVAAGMTGVAQQGGAKAGASAQAGQGQQLTVQGCVQSGSGGAMSSTSSNYGNRTGSTGSTSSTSSTGATGSTATGATSTGSTGTAGSTGATTGTHGATAQTGQAAGAGRGNMNSNMGHSGGMYSLRVTGGSGNSRTGMPSATAGQTDSRSAAGQQGGQVYQLMADGATDLSKHVGHQVEITGTLSAGASSSHSGHAMPSANAGATATTGAGAAGAGSGSSGYTGQATSGSGGTGSGAAGGTGSSAKMGSMAGQSAGQAGMGGTLKVTNLKMISTTCQ